MVGGAVPFFWWGIVFLLRVFLLILVTFGLYGGFLFCWFCSSCFVFFNSYVNVCFTFVVLFVC